MKNKKFTGLLISGAVAILLLIVALFLLLPRLTGGSQSNAPALTLPKLSKTAAQTKPTEPRVKVVQDRFKAMHDENPDMYGWITLPNSRVDYPVMRDPASSSDQWFYLKRNFQKQEDIYGVPFIDARSAEDSDIYLIYGHETDNGTQFHDFLQYQNEEFFKENPYFLYSDLEHTYQYEIVAFLRSPIYAPSDNVFKIYNYFGTKDKEDFDYYIKNVKAMQFYETGVTPQYGDHLISIMTCMTPYEADDADKFFIVARRGKQVD